MRIEDEDMPKIADITHKAVRKFLDETKAFTHDGTPVVDDRWPRLVRVMNDRFIVAFEVYIKLPKYTPEDPYENYTLEQVHVVYQVIWKNGSRFLRVLDVHEDCSHSFYDTFYCGACPSDMMKGRKPGVN